MDIDKPKLIKLPKIEDARGNLSFLESQNHIPFKIKRAYWMYDVPGGEKRGGYAFNKLQQFIIALSGSFDVIIANDDKKEKFHLCRSYYGLYIPNRNWCSFENFSTNSLCLTLASEHYDPNDIIANFNGSKNV